MVAPSSFPGNEKPPGGEIGTSILQNYPNGPARATHRAGRSADPFPETYRAGTVFIYMWRPGIRQAGPDRAAE